MAFVLKQIDVWAPLLGDDFEKNYSPLPNQDDFRHRVLDFLRDPVPSLDASSSTEELHLIDKLAAARRKELEHMINKTRAVVLEFETRVELRCNVIRNAALFPAIPMAGY